MKRIFAVALALFLLLSSVALSEEPYVAAERLPYANQEAEARAYADAMQERFGVTILIGDECQSVLAADTFQIGDHAPARSPFLSLLGVKFTTDELKKLEKALEQYPPELFSLIKDNNAPEGLRFFIADQIVDADPAMNSIGYAVCEGSYYNIVLAYMLFDQATVHHEIWHAMEMFITAKHPDAFMIWDAFNPDGFQYSHDYTADTEDFNADYFARGYGTVDPLEDRATIAEAVFFENRNEWFSQRPAIKRKLDAMNLALKDTLVIQYNVKTSTKEVAGQ